MVKLQSRYEQLLTDGFCTIENVLDEVLLRDLREVTEELVKAQPKEMEKRHRFTGSMVNVRSHPVFGRLISCPKALQALSDLGFDHPQWSSGYVISKPPHSPGLFWHQDWWGWDEPCSYEDLPQQLFLMYYLVDTRPFNGCLRVIPRSHRKRHPLHDLLPEAHTDATYNASESEVTHGQAEGEVDVPVKAGDLVIGDSRLLHASHANQSEAIRTVITLWYVPAYSQMPEGIRARYARSHSLDTPAGWTPEAWEPVKPLIPQYSGNAETTRWNRMPGPGLR